MLQMETPPLVIDAPRRRRLEGTNVSRSRGHLHAVVPLMSCSWRKEAQQY